MAQVGSAQLTSLRTLLSARNRIAAGPVQPAARLLALQVCVDPVQIVIVFR